MTPGDAVLAGIGLGWLLAFLLALGCHRILHRQEKALRASAEEMRESLAQARRLRCDLDRLEAAGKGDNGPCTRP